MRHLKSIVITTCLDLSFGPVISSECHRESRDPTMAEKTRERDEREADPDSEDTGETKQGHVQQTESPPLKSEHELPSPPVNKMPYIQIP